MEQFNLSFGTINKLHEHLAEVIIDDGVEMNLKMVNEYHQFLISHFNAPFSLLVNKIHSYSYDVQAQEMLATIEQIKDMAVVSYKPSTTFTTEVLANYPRKTKWHLKIFHNREAAIQWLENNLNNNNTDYKESSN